MPTGNEIRARNLDTVKKGGGTFGLTQVPLTPDDPKKMKGRVRIDPSIQFDPDNREAQSPEHQGVAQSSYGVLSGLYLDPRTGEDSRRTTSGNGGSARASHPQTPLDRGAGSGPPMLPASSAGAGDLRAGGTQGRERGPHNGAGRGAGDQSRSGGAGGRGYSSPNNPESAKRNDTPSAPDRQSVGGGGKEQAQAIAQGAGERVKAQGVKAREEGGGALLVQ